MNAHVHNRDDVECDGNFSFFFFANLIEPKSQQTSEYGLCQNIKIITDENC